MPPMPPMPPIPPPGIGGIGSLGSGNSATIASVVSNKPAIEEAFSRAVLTTLTGSIIPDFTKSVYDSV